VVDRPPALLLVRHYNRSSKFKVQSSKLEIQEPEVQSQQPPRRALNFEL
jgi:hypothetical protein